MTRRGDGAAGRLQFFLRICVALAVALLSVPLLGFSAQAEEGAPADATTAEAPADPGTDPPPDEAPPAEEPAAESPPAEEPAAEEPAADEPAAEEPAAEEPSAEAPEAAAAEEPETDAAPKKAAVKTVEADAVEALASNCAASFDQNTQEDHGGAWINGALNQNNSNYAEGDYVPQRVELTGLSPGTHTLTFSFDRTKNGLYAYDFVDHLSISGSAGASVSWDAEAPNPPMPFAVTVFVTIEFTIVANDPTATLVWEGHIASELDYGPDMGAGTINGAPYHFSLVDMSCGNVGQQDNQLMADAVDAGELTIVKDAQPNAAQDFHFTLDAPNDLDTAFDLDDDGDATLPNSVTYRVPPGATTATEVNIASGWTLTDITCTEAGVEAGSAVTVTLSDDEHITCTFTNSRESSLEVDKYWVINGGAPVQEGSEPAHLGLGAQLTVNGGNQPWDTSIGGFLQDASVTLNESVTFGNDLCDWAGSTHGSVTEDSSGGVHDGGALPYTDSLWGGANHYTITNVVTCDSTLTLVKDVLNGPALASAWTLSASPVDGTDLPFASGSTGVSHTVSADSAYVLDENDADSRYSQVGPWTCTQFGSVSTIDGEQRVAVEAGRTATCTVQNATAELILRKVVENPNGGTAVAGDFTLVASPQSGAADLSTPGSEQGTSFFVNPGETFDLSETGGPVDYTLTGINCGSGPVMTVKVPISTTVTCTYTNVDSPGSLTLDKIVDDNDSGVSTPESAWHLSGTPQGIADQPTIEGDGGATGATKAGVYALDETGPDTHTEGDWTCVDAEGAPVAVNADDEVTVGANEDVTCTITNTAIKPSITLIKHVDPGDTGDETGPEAFTLFAIPDGIDGQATVSGPGPQVDADVKAGTYTLDEEEALGYEMDAAGWTCADAQDNPVPVSASDQVTIGLAEHVTCEVTNNAIPSSWMVSKTSDPVSGSTVSPGDEINYTVTVTRVGDGVNVENIDVVDTLTGIEDAWVSDIVASNGTAVLNGGVIDWHIDEVSDTVTLTYTVTVGQVFGATLKNVVTPGPTPCPDPVDDDPNVIDCDETTHFTPHFLLDKAVDFDDPDGDGMAEPGQELTYTLTMTNDTEKAVLLDAVVTDDLAKVLDNGTIVESAAELAAQGLVLSGTTLTWTVAELQPGDIKKATYTVLIGDGQWGQVLHNVATPTPGGPGECIPPPEALECETTTETPPVTTLVIEKQNFETQEVLEGATFELWHDVNNAGPDPDSGDCTFASPPVVDDQDELLGTEVTDGDGLALFADLQHGCYLLVETAPPPGYALPEVRVLGIAINELNFVAGGEMSPIVITDFAEGQLAIVAKRQFELVGDEWVESDGEVAFGDLVKYRVRINATGPKVFHNVRVTDYVPGFNPEDTQTTTPGTLVEGSPVCTGNLACTTSVDADQLVTWDIGTLSPGAGETIGGSVEMIVRFADLPDDIDVDPGETFTSAMWNVGFLAWDEVVGGTPPAEEPAPRAGGMAAGRLASAALAFEFETHTLRSNEVLVKAFFTPELQKPPPPPPKTPDKPLPDTGAQAYLGQLAALGGLVLALGMALVARGRRKEEQEG